MENRKNREECEAINDFGYIFIMNGQYDKAIENFNIAIKIDPNYYLSFFYRGLAYSRKRQYDKSIKNYTRAIELNPNLAITYTNMGIAYIQKEQHSMAIKNFNRAIELNPGYAPSYVHRGMSHIGNKKDPDGMDKGITDLKKARDLGEKIAINL